MATETKQSIKETHPHLAKEWHPTKNGDLKPEMFTKGSHKKIWWQCKEGHEWEAEIKSRTMGSKNGGTGCPYCSNSKLLPGYNDLKTKHPELAAQFDEEKNGVKASEILAANRNKYWWKCENGHSWEARTDSRVNGAGCPYCSGRRVTKETSLQAKRPDLAAQWHPTKNGKVTPEDITSQTNDPYWWLCPVCGHEWEATPNNRVKGTGCPNCASIERRQPKKK